MSKKSRQKKLRQIKGTPFWIQRLPNGEFGMFAHNTGCLRVFLWDPRDSERQFDLERFCKSRKSCQRPRCAA